MQVRHWYENVRHAAELNLEAEPLQQKALPCKAVCCSYRKCRWHKDLRADAPSEEVH